MESRHVFILILILSLFDGFAINLSYAVAHLLQTATGPGMEVDFKFLLIINFSWLFSSIVNKLYRYNSVQTIGNLCHKSLLTFCCQVLLIGVCVARLQPPAVNEILVFNTLITEFLTFGLIRAAIYLTERYHLNLNNYKKRIAIIGYNDVSESMAKYFKQNRLSFNFEGHFTYLGSEAECNSGTAISNINDIIANRLDEVYAISFPEENENFAKVVELAEKHCVRVRYIASPLVYDTSNISLQSKYALHGVYNGIPILFNRPEPLSALHNRILKRLFDIAFSLFVIIFLLSWLTPIIALIIRLESPGSTFFRQKRSGKNNKPFWCFKFRSMRVNKASDKLQATKNDARITRVGAFLRKTSIDELPQFINVLFGNMSIVGPRPHMLTHTDQYRHIIDQYMVRLFLKPGITGWAQINGHRGETRDDEQMKNRISHDIWYMENWSIVRDVKIIYQTVVNALKGEENAY